ncbi:MAG: universal stress protein [Nocardioidaceae bacterium]
MTRGRIVVFGDHTPGATQALRWSVKEAARRGLVVHVVRPFDRTGRADLALESDLERARLDSRYRTQSWVIEAVGDLQQGVPVSISTPDCSTADALVNAARDAELVVIGADGPEVRQLAERIRPLCSCPVQVGTEHPTPA